ncbi:hypothetical protein I2483_06680 [Sporosarcina sp. E16_3]|uniref:hypothetical protein n=1 Tax=Sporosarcina sp. E16_3 TaxID=2789293 RepID=UPI001A922061|nr:hypothetical protein [Sporosarcina sp. E16_3]MBO0601341.1 hypothetical protein [Sporosarcina sp. E16_3]
MSHNKNERGGALVMVLLLVLVFTILGMGLLTMNISAAKQFNKKEEQVQARHFAEMGVLHYQAKVKEMIEEHNNKIKSITHAEILSGINTEFCRELNNEKKLPEEINGEKQSNYTVSLKGTSGCDSISTEIKLTINSVGKSGINREVEIDADITFRRPNTLFDVVSGGGENGGNNLPPTTPTENVNVEYGNFNIKNGAKQYETSIHIKEGKKGEKGQLTVEPGKNEGGTDATFQNDLYVEGVVDIHNQGCIAVQGNFTATESLKLGNKAYLYIYGNANLPSSINLHNNHAEIYVSGDVYINGVKQVPEKYSAVPIKNSECSPPGPGDNGGSGSLKATKWDLNTKIEASYM